MLGASCTANGAFARLAVNQKRDKLDVTVATRLPLARYRALENWCRHSMRRRSELVGIVLDRVIEIYELEAKADEPLEFFIRRLHLDGSL
jgi:hypothetical protein